MFGKVAFCFGSKCDFCINLRDFLDPLHTTSAIRERKTDREREKCLTRTCNGKQIEKRVKKITEKKKTRLKINFCEILQLMSPQHENRWKKQQEETRKKVELRIEED